MKKIGTYRKRQVYWSEYESLLKKKLPYSNWICLITSSNSKPNEKVFDEFTRNAISNRLLEFKGHGTYGEILHDWFDQTMVIMESMENYPEIEVMTTWHNNETLADTFWQCFFATCLPDSTDYDNVQIVCCDIDGISRTEELKEYLRRFEIGWLPKNLNMKQSIKIKSINVEHDEVQFEIIISNGITSCSLDFYGYYDEFIDLGNKLRKFPKNIDEVVLYELGEQDPKWAYYMQLKTYCYQPTGYTAIDIIIDNHGTNPYQNKATFSIQTLPASINKLGEILGTWNPKYEKEIEWIAE